jgi:hypothetical protein
MSQTEKSVIPFAPMDKGNDQLDKAGQSILNLLHKATAVHEQPRGKRRWVDHYYQEPFGKS